MNEADKPQVLRETDDEARNLAERLIRTARYGALASLEPETGYPLASRVAVATMMDGTPVVLISALSGHYGALERDKRCSLLLGEPAAGDPLAHPRITVLGSARFLDRQSAECGHARQRYLARHPKAQLYVDFADFSFVSVELERASLNGGFGKAYDLARGDICLAGSVLKDLSEIEAGAVAHMNKDHQDAVQLYATRLCRQPEANWKVSAIDPAGLDMVAGDRVCRLAFPEPLDDAGALRGVLATLAKQAREI